MRRRDFVLAALGVGLARRSVCAEPLTAGDRSFLIDYLARSQQMFHDEVTGLSQAQWRFKPLPQRWSVAECAEHIILAEQWLMAQFLEKFAATSEPAYIFHWRTPRPGPRDFPSAPRAERAAVYRERVAREIDRSKVDPTRPPEGDPPEPSLTPRFRYANPKDAAVVFDSVRRDTITFVDTTMMDLYENYVYPGAGTRLLDGYEYLLRIPAHAERHVAQMREVKAHPAFPTQ